jgi:hypothetical protein
MDVIVGVFREVETLADGWSAYLTDMNTEAEIKSNWCGHEEGGIE